MKKEKIDETLLCPTDLFRYFIRSVYTDVPIDDSMINEFRVGFAEYLTSLNLTEEQKENILPKSIFDTILSIGHPFKVNGFPPAYILHFAKFIELEKSKLITKDKVRKNNKPKVRKTTFGDIPALQELKKQNGKGG